VENTALENTGLENVGIEIGLMERNNYAVYVLRYRVFHSRVFQFHVFNVPVARKITT